MLLDMLSPFANFNTPNPGLGLREYLIIISPPDHIKKDIHAFKKEISRITGNESPIKSVAHITLFNIPTVTIPESNLIKELEFAVNTWTPFEVLLDGFDCFSYSSSQTIYAKPNSENILKLLKPMALILHRRAKVPNKFLGFSKVPHMTIAKKIGDKHFDDCWGLFKNRIYNEKFFVKHITVLRKNHSLDEKKFRLIAEVPFTNTRPN